MRAKLHVHIILAILLNRYLFSSQVCSNIETQFLVFFSFVFLQLNQSHSLLEEDVDFEDLPKKIPLMDHYFALGEVNKAIQEADTLLFLLKMIVKQVNEDEGLFRVSSEYQI